MKNNWIEAVEVLEKEPSLYSYMRHCPLDVLKNLQVKHYPADRFFSKQGEYYDNIYFVVRGELEIFVSSNQGKKYHQATYTKGDFLGEMEAFGQYPFISSVCALTDIELLVLPREDYLRWLEADRVFADHILKKICRDYYTISVMSANNLLHGLKQRICHYLYKNMVEEKGPPLCAHYQRRAERKACRNTAQRKPGVKGLEGRRGHICFKTQHCYFKLASAARGIYHDGITG